MKRSASRQHWWAVGSLCIVLIAALVDVHWVLYPRIDRPPVAPDGIVVLNGADSNARRAEGFVLAERFPGARLLVSVPVDPSVCRHPPVITLITCFVPHPSTTKGEAEDVADFAVSHKWRSLIVVATVDQLSRARLRFQRCWSGSLSLQAARTSRIAQIEEVPYQSAATFKALVFQRRC